MSEPSDYEKQAWSEVQDFRGRASSRMARSVNEKASGAASKIGQGASDYLENHPKADQALSKGREVVGAIGDRARKAVDAIPEEVGDWGGAALGDMKNMLAKASRVGLTPKGVVEHHQKLGHEVQHLYELRRLYLEQVDAVRAGGFRRGLSWYYPAMAAVSGGGAAFMMTGGQASFVGSGGAAAAPSFAVIAGAFTADAAFVFGASSRAIGHIALLYGYDPEVPTEKLFIMSVINLGTATSVAAKTAALADMSKLTQALFRGKTWAVLNEALVATVTTQFAKAFGVRLTKKTLGKIVPVVGVAVGASMNWTTLEGIVDAADFAYRRRFLLEKYPQLGVDVVPGSFIDNGSDCSDDEDEVISIIDQIRNAGGPDLREPEFADE